MRTIVMLLVIIVMGACHDVKKPEPPENLIPKDKMVNVILDMSLLTAAKGVDRVELENRGIMPEDFVYEKHGIDSLQFASSNNYYAYNIVVYEAIYNQVNDSLKTLKDVFKTEQEAAEAAKRKADSIKKAQNKPKSLNKKVLKDSLIQKK